MNGIKTIIRRILEQLRLIPRTDIGVMTVSTNPAPDSVPSLLLVLVGEGHFHKWAYLACPCGCGHPIMLSLSKTKRPAWHVGIDWLGRPTVEPSVRQTAGCYSHFWLRKGRIDWCGGTGKPWRNSP